MTQMAVAFHPPDTDPEIDVSDPGAGYLEVLYAVADTDRPRRSRRQTTSVSSVRSWSRTLSSSGRRRVLPRWGLMVAAAPE
jgi:hypothetical protein